MILTYGTAFGQGGTGQLRRLMLWVLPHPGLLRPRLGSVSCLQKGTRSCPTPRSTGSTTRPGAAPAAGLVRTLRPRPAGTELLDLASNDYLGLSRNPEVIAAAAEAARTWGAGSTGSRLVTGSTALHAELERELAAFCGFEAALVFSSGYAANLAALTALTAHDSLIVSDAGEPRLDRGRLPASPGPPPPSCRTRTPRPCARRSTPTADGRWW